MVENVRYLSVFFVVAFSMFDNVEAQLPNSVIQSIQSNKFAHRNPYLVEYIENRDSVSVYSCAMHVETTSDNFEDPSNSNFKENWYFHAFDRESNVRRQDQILMQFGQSLDGLGTTSSEQPLTTFVSMGKNLVQIDGSTRRELKLVPGEELEKLKNQCKVDPWGVPIMGQTLFLDGSNGLEKGDSLRNYLSALEVTDADFPETAEADVFEFKSSKTALIFDRISFGKRVGNMPQMFERIHRKPRSKGVKEAGRTKWINKNGVWFPSEFKSDWILGDPSKPNEVRTTVVRFSWLVGKQCPPQIFQHNPLKIRSPELKLVHLSVTRD